jgi:dTDP-4-dehydrorhamnose reductase
MKIMVVGARGMLGTDLMAAFAPHHPSGFDLPELDITDAAQCRERMREARPDAVIHAAALTDVDYCEAHEEEAYRVNGEGTGNLAEAASAAGALLIYYSTDYLFDGASAEGYREEDAPHPLSVYGKSKRMGENLVRDAGAHHLILRTSWLFGCNGKNFIRTIVGIAREGKALRVVDDQRGSPTYTRDLAERTAVLLQAGCRGTYHVTNRGACTWYELACRSVAWAGVAGADVTPVTTREFPRPAPRPACSILRHARMEREQLPPMRPWEEAVQDYLAACLSRP